MLLQQPVQVDFHIKLVVLKLAELQPVLLKPEYAVEQAFVCQAHFRTRCSRECAPYEDSILVDAKSPDNCYYVLPIRSWKILGEGLTSSLVLCNALGPLKVSVCTGYFRYEAYEQPLLCLGLDVMPLPHLIVAHNK